MAKYLIDPIYAYREIKDNFILYVKTAFGTRYKSIEEEREELLRTDQVAAREPWVNHYLLIRMLNWIMVKSCVFHR